jgi:hypothetical protein
MITGEHKKVDKRLAELLKGQENLQNMKKGQKDTAEARDLSRK